jgi:hypothetical protein
MDANQARADANMKTHIQEIIAKMEDNYERMMAEILAETEVIRSRTKARQEKRMESNFTAFLIETVACQETTEARLRCKEPISEDMESGAEHREVPKEHAVVRSWGIRKK